MIHFGIPAEKKKRVLILSDVNNEVDDQFAIVHALLTESLDVRGIIPTHFSWKRENTRQESRQELDKLLKLLDREDVLVADGAEDVIEKVENIPPSVSMILRESKRETQKETQTGVQNEGRLFLVCLGPLTDLALALREDPTLADRPVTVLWIGGLSGACGGKEPNLCSDPAAAREVFASGIDLWQIPRDVYSLLPVSFAELYVKVRPFGDIGKYLAENVVQFNNSSLRKPAEYRVLGDSPAIGLLMNEDLGRWKERTRPVIREDLSYGWPQDQKQMRIYETMDTRFILEDFYAKLQLIKAENRKNDEPKGYERL